MIEWSICGDRSSACSVVRFSRSVASATYLSEMAGLAPRGGRPRAERVLTPGGRPAGIASRIRSRISLSTSKPRPTTSICTMSPLCRLLSGRVHPTLHGRPASTALLRPGELLRSRRRGPAPIRPPAAPAQAVIVAPVVTTSSTSRATGGAGPSPRCPGAAASAGAPRAAALAAQVAAAKAPGRRSSRCSPARPMASSQAGSKPRRSERIGAPGNRDDHGLESPPRRAVRDQRGAELRDDQQARELERRDEPPPGAAVGSGAKPGVDPVGVEAILPGSPFDLDRATPTERRPARRTNQWRPAAETQRRRDEPEDPADRVNGPSADDRSAPAHGW